MTILILAFLPPLLAILQSTLLFQGLPGGVTLDLCLLLTIFCGLRFGATSGSVAGLWAGAIVGALQAWATPLLAILYGLTGWLAGVHSERQPSTLTYPLVGLTLITLLTVVEAQLRGIRGEHFPLHQLLAYLAWHGLFCLSFLVAKPSPTPHLS